MGITQFLFGEENDTICFLEENDTDCVSFSPTLGHWHVTKVFWGVYFLLHLVVIEAHGKTQDCP